MRGTSQRRFHSNRPHFLSRCEGADLIRYFAMQWPHPPALGQQQLHRFLAELSDGIVDGGQPRLHVRRELDVVDPHDRYKVSDRFEANARAAASGAYPNSSIALRTLARRPGSAVETDSLAFPAGSVSGDDRRAPKDDVHVVRPFVVGVVEDERPHDGQAYLAVLAGLAVTAHGVGCLAWSA